MKKLYKSNTDKKIDGVCGGIAEYFGIDVTLVRVIFAISIFFGGAGIWAYLVCALIMPGKPSNIIEAE